jgi:glycerophosphoryl diester phosphodiesterase
MPRMHADCLQVPQRWGVLRIDRRFVKAAHRAGLPVHVWTVDDAAEMEILLDLGVDGIMTDRPRLLKQVMEARGLW